MMALRHYEMFVTSARGWASVIELTTLLVPCTEDPYWVQDWAGILEHILQGGGSHL